MTFDIFNELGLSVFVQMNNRKVLFGIFKASKISEKQFVDVALSLDKLEKSSQKDVEKELR